MIWEDPGIYLEPEAPFWENVLVENSAAPMCWPWIGARRSAGYGAFRGIVAHRYSWALQNCMIPHIRLVICHDCDYRPCVNPNHLTLGTRKDNSDDIDARGRRRVHVGNRDPRAKAPCSRCGMVGRWPIPYKGESIGRDCDCFDKALDADEINLSFSLPSRWDRTAPATLADLSLRATPAALEYLAALDIRDLVNPISREGNRIL